MTKYRKGRQIKSLDELYKCDFIFWRNKVYHKGWFGNWQIRYAKAQIEQGLVFKAEHKARTFVECLRLDYPNKTEQQIEEIVKNDCPFLFGYEELRSCPSGVEKCFECWERRIGE